MNGDGSIKKGPIEIEKEFNSIKSIIKGYILQEDSQTPSDALFQRLDDEFKKVKREYEYQNDKKNLLHVEHNYLWSKSFQYLYEDPTKSLSLIIKAFSKLLDRYRLYPYLADSFEKMLGVYEVAFIKISEKGEFINFNQIESEFINFIETYLSTTSISSDKFEELINIIGSLYDKKISGLKIPYSNFNESDVLADSIKSILDVLEKVVNKNYYLLSLRSSYCEALYKLRKKQLHFQVRFLFLEKSEKKKRDAQNIIDQITYEMVDYSRKSLKGAKKFISKLPSEKQNDEKIKKMITPKEIDKLTAEYYKEAYSNKDILKAVSKMDKIKQFLVMKAFKENIPLSDDLLRYYSEEWALLSVFAMVCLLKEEITKRVSSISQDWERDVFIEITRTLDMAEKLFKYEMVDKKDHTLKIMTSSFAGHFSEYFIHELCQEFFNFGVIDEKTPSEFRNLLQSITSAENKDDIILNDVLEQGKPDIDIHIKNKCAIFLKNSKIKTDEVKKIWNEIELCNKKKINNVFYGINFIKNIEKIEYIRQAFERMRLKNPNLDINVFDIEDLVSVFLDELERSGKSKLNFSRSDLYRVLDY